MAKKKRGKTAKKVVVVAGAALLLWWLWPKGFLSTGRGGESPTSSRQPWIDPDTQYFQLRFEPDPSDPNQPRHWYAILIRPDGRQTVISGWSGGKPDADLFLSLLRLQLNRDKAVFPSVKRAVLENYQGPSQTTVFSNTFRGTVEKVFWAAGLSDIDWASTGQFEAVAAGRL